MNNLRKVSLLRVQLINEESEICKQPGIYCWWFKKDSAERILSILNLKESEIDRIQKREIEGEEYWALYFGISNDMLGRAKWHILQKHSISAVKYGTLSTLRQSLSALLDIDMSCSEDAVNKFMDRNCYWEWEYTDDFKEKETIELSSDNKCYPINIQENQKIGKDIIKKLKDIRKKHKK